MSIQIIYLLLICLIYCIVCFMYGKYRSNNPEFNDPLLYKFGIGDMDGWSVVHIFEFILLGFLFPDYFYLTIFLGILWELFEFYCEYKKPKWLIGYGFTLNTVKCDNKNECKEQIWWYGKISDIFFDIIGFTIGMNIRKLIIS